MILLYDLFLISFLITKVGSYDYCVPQGLEDMLKKPAVPTLCRPPTPYCDYDNNVCITGNHQNEELNNPAIKTTCIDPTSSFFQNKVLDENLSLNCRPPTPYCDFENNLCVSKFTTYFQCRTNGRFPHITDCKGSMICKNGEISEQPCKDSTFYDVHSKKCVQGKEECRIPNCKGMDGTYVKHPGSMNLFVLCISEVPVSMYNCPADYIFSGNKNAPCMAFCTELRIYRDLYDETKYFKCKLVNGNRERSLRDCPPNTYFDEISCECKEKKLKPQAEKQPMYRKRVAHSYINNLYDNYLKNKYVI